MESNLANVAGMFKINTDIVNKAIADIGVDDWFRKPGDDSNHLMWVLGHLVVHRGRTLKTLGVDWDSSWATLFTRGAQRVANDEYPSVEEMRTAWNQVSDELSAALRQSSADVLAKEAPAGPPSFDGKTSGTVAFFAFHDTYHTGQTELLRQVAGKNDKII